MEEHNDMEKVLHRIEAVEADVSRLLASTKVAGVFLVFVLGIGAWYLKDRDSQIADLTGILQEVSTSITKLQVTMEFYASAINSHINSEETHPDNTARVDRLIEDVRDIESEVKQISNGRPK